MPAPRSCSSSEPNSFTSGQSRVCHVRRARWCSAGFRKLWRPMKCARHREVVNVRQMADDSPFSRPSLTVPSRGMMQTHNVSYPWSRTPGQDHLQSDRPSVALDGDVVQCRGTGVPVFEAQGFEVMTRDPSRSAGRAAEQAAIVMRDRRSNTAGLRMATCQSSRIRPAGRVHRPQRCPMNGTLVVIEADDQPGVM